jgi:Na+/phosphate symporter
MDGESFSLIPMLSGLASGLALFLHGMTMMSNAMRAMAGCRLSRIHAVNYRGAMMKPTALGAGK